jgi:hypothetical protein
MVVNYHSIYLITLAPDLQYIQGIRVLKCMPVIAAVEQRP